MPKINENSNSFTWLYKVGFLIILSLPILIAQPYFFPADWGKSIVFRSIIAIILFLLSFQLLLRKNELFVPNVKKNIIFWLLTSLFSIFLLATIFSVDPSLSFWGNPYRGGGFITFAFCIAFSVLSFVLLRKDDWTKAWFFTILIGVLISLTAIVQYNGIFSKLVLSASDRPASTMGSPIILAVYLLLLLFPAISFAIKENNKYLKSFYIFSILVFLYTILITGSRAAYLGIAVGALYFFLLYPKKLKAIKLTVVGLLVLAVCFVFYVNTANNYPNFLKQNNLFKSVTERLSVRLFLMDPRFYTWAGVDYKILLDKPILGYGPENFSVGFDKHYDPSIPYLNKDWGSWWDKAHNISIQTVSDAGFFALIIYLSLFAVLLWKLQKSKSLGQPDKNITVIHGLQATLIGYFTALLFSFDTFGTYLIFFFIIGFCMHIIYNDENAAQNQIQKNSARKKLLLCILAIVLAIFLWQYNIVPLKINAEINKAGILAKQKQCPAAFNILDTNLQKHSFLDSYNIMQYIEIEKICANYYPENGLTYAKKGTELLTEAVKLQPLYSRYWIWLSSLTTNLAIQEGNTETKNSLLKQSTSYLDKASQLAPKHEEILIERARIEMAGENYKKMQEYSKKCISLSPSIGDCYWYLGLSEIYINDKIGADKDILLAASKGYDTNSGISLSEIANAYGSIPDYKNLVLTLEKLVTLSPNSTDYRSLLATLYKKLGDYSKARQEALKILQLSPESKQNIDQFLNTLPQ